MLNLIQINENKNNEKNKKALHLVLFYFFN